MYYDSIIEITNDYLGPASQRFIDRQIALYLHKSSKEITRADVNMLAVRIRSGLMILTRDTKVVDEAFRRITSIADIPENTAVAKVFFTHLPVVVN
ncbi:MAG: hypothetical protein M3Q24_00365 [bacterium]|nr:hypothetical protein [bacterium]